MEMSVATTLLLTFLTAPNFLIEFTQGQEGSSGCYVSNEAQIVKKRMEYRCFGPGGRYDCNCANNGSCDGNNGSCLDKPSKCRQGWSGPSCRRKNLSARSNNQLTDSDDSTCNLTSQGNVTVDVENLTISTVIVTADKGNFSLELRSPHNPGKMVKWVKKLSANRYWFPVQENNNFRYLSFRSSAGQVSICEVRLHDCEENWFGRKCDKQCHCTGSCDRALGHCTGGCESGWSGDSCQHRNYENVAVNKPAWQTSVYVNDLLFKNVRNTSYPAQLAVDGDPDGYFNHLSCTHTAPRDHNPEWTVDLGSYYTISWIRIYNRLSHNRYRLKGFKVYVSNSSSSSGELCFEDTWRNKGGQVIIDIHCEPSLRGRYVKIKKTTEFLTLCEVEIMKCKRGWRGDYCQEKCSKGKYGAGCLKNCSDNCQENVCHHISGTCGNGCKPGYKGDKCIKKCEKRKFGPGCGYSCNTNCKSGECDHVTGHCAGGCEAGYQADHCNMNCSSGYYGPDCKYKCSMDCQTNKCNHISGHCTEGCKPGFVGDKCDKSCSPGSYGANCTSRCENCKNGSCNHISGDCSDGCTPGFVGDKCDHSCSPGSYGANCTSRCENCKNGSCNHISGDCSDGCTPGFVGDKCDHSCSPGSYGANCTSRCENCKNGSCNHISGDCRDGCIPGFFGDNCNKKCSRGFYGSGCKNSCNTCENENCNFINGTCIDGCKSGFLDDDCKQKVAPSLNKDDVAMIVGPVLVIIGLLIVASLILTWRKKSSEVSGIKATKLEDDDTNGIIHLKPVKSDDENMDENIYSNDTLIPVQNFEDYFLKKNAIPRAFSTEFENLPKGLLAPYKAALREENLVKNRYKNMYAYDHSRVVLDTSDGFSDYINACYVDGYYKPKRYIASQGATRANIIDFWRMIWQMNSRKIVMVTHLFESGKQKCLKYWPDVGQENTYGFFVVRCLHEELYASFVTRILEVSKQGEEASHQIKQFHFIAWPDHDVPENAYNLVDFRNKVHNDTTTSNSGPVVVHCSAGVGRTGTFIVVDYLLDHIGNGERYLDVFTTVSTMRNQRVKLVQTQEQYVFIHQTLVEAMKMSETEIAAQDFVKYYQNLCSVNPATNQLYMVEQFQTLLSWASLHFKHPMHIPPAASEPDNIAINRFSDVFPGNESRVFLTTRVKGRNDYIEAVFLPDFVNEKEYLITQTPLPDTVIDFWRLIYDQRSRSIVMIDDFTDPSSAIYWPKNKTSVQYGPFTVEATDVSDHGQYLVRTLKVTKTGLQKGEENSLQIRQFVCSFWPNKDNVPLSAASLLGFIQDVQDCEHSQRSPIVVHCSNGAEKSGLFCVVSSLISKLKTESTVNIVQTIKQMQQNHRQIIPNMKQFQFCYKSVHEFIENFGMYNN